MIEMIPKLGRKEDCKLTDDYLSWFPKEFLLIKYTEGQTKNVK